MRREYSKPFMKREHFAANEFVAACWYAKEDDFYTELYQDKYTNLAGNWGTYNWLKEGGKEDLNPPSSPTGGIPTSGGHIKGDAPAQIMDTSSDGNRYYTAYDDSKLNPPYYNQVTTIYTYTYNNTLYYLKDYTDDGGNHS